MNLEYPIKYAGLIFLLMIATVGCTSEGRPTMQEKIKGPADIKTALVTQKTAHYTLSLPGELAPFEQVRLFAKVRGFVHKRHVDRGSVVKKANCLPDWKLPKSRNSMRPPRQNKGKLPSSSIIVYKPIKDYGQQPIVPERWLLLNSSGHIRPL